jgi:hypothetical protein
MAAPIVWRRRKRRRVSDVNIDDVDPFGEGLKYVAKHYFSSLKDHELYESTDCSGMEADPTGDELNDIPQGDGDGYRSGRQIALTSVTVKGCVRAANIPANITRPTVYVSLVLDKQANANTANSEDVYIKDSDSPVLAAMFYRNPAHLRRFEVLDEVLMEPTAPHYWDTGQVRVEITQAQFAFRLHYDFDDFLTVNYDGSGAPTDNSLHVMATAGNIGDDSWYLYYEAEVQYLDDSC